MRLASHGISFNNSPSTTSSHLREVLEEMDESLSGVSPFTTRAFSELHPESLSEKTAKPTTVSA